MSLVLVIAPEQGVHDKVSYHLEGVVDGVLHAFRTDSGIELAFQRKPDIILLSSDFPSHKGFDACRKLKESYDTRRIPIVFITTQSDPNLIAHGLDLGAVDFITVPFSALELQARVRVALRNHKAMKDLEARTRRDLLTGLHNRNAFFEEYDRICESFRRTKEPFGLLLLDLDFFKTLNNKHGFTAGNEVLKRIGTVIKGSSRANDYSYRFSGDRFAVVYQQVSRDNAISISQRLIFSIGLLEIPGEKEVLSITASGGLATMPGHKLNEMVDDAARALNKAKSAGRNRVSIAPHTVKL